MKTVSDLLEDAKRRTVLLCLWVVGGAYLMSLTSHSVWVNIPVAFLIIAVIRSLSGEVQIRWKAGQTSPPASSSRSRARYRPYSAKGRRLGSGQGVYEIWRREIEAPEVEAALEELTKSVVGEFVTNLWFRSVSSDQEFPDELANMINSVFAELSRRVKRINLINLLTKDIVNLVSSHLELFRRTQARVGADTLGILSAEERDDNIKQTLVSAGELHPALVSADSEYRVLHELMGGLIALVLRHEDANCRVAKTLARELLACSVMRPVMNLLNPGFINTLIENAAARAPAPVAPVSDSSKAPAKRPPDRPPLHREPSSDVGLDAVAVAQPRAGQEELDGRGALKSSSSEASLIKLGEGGDILGKLGRGEDGSSLPLMEDLLEGSAPKKLDGKGQSANYGHQGARDSKEDWAQLLEVMNQRKTLALAPEHLDNLWTKGRNYKKRESNKPSGKSVESNATKEQTGKPVETNATKEQSGKPVETNATKEQSGKSVETNATKEQPISHPLGVEQSIPPAKFKPEGNPKKHVDLVEPRAESAQNSAKAGTSQMEPSLTLEEWNAAKTIGTDPASYRQMRRSRSIGAELDGWQALAHPGEGIPSLLKAGDGIGLGPGFDLDLALRKKLATQTKLEEAETLALSSMLCNHLQVDVVGAHFEKGGSKTFAVYSIFVTDLQNRTWEVQRRFRNFEQLHRNLKDKPYYNLSLPAKRFLSSNLDNSFIRQRCALLDKYLKDLLAIPSIAEVYEVWDFLSPNSQTYAFGESPSMFKTLTSNVDDAVDDMFRQLRGSAEVKAAPATSVNEIRKQVMMGSNTSPSTAHLPILTNSSNTRRSAVERSASQNIWEEDGQSTQDGQNLGLGWIPEYDMQQTLGTSPYGSDPGMLDALRDAQTFEGKQDRALSEGDSPAGSLAGSDLAEDDHLAVPPDWGPPKVSVPLLNLVDVIFELQGRGWIRRQVFWMAKQVLQLGMGDAIDDFLLSKIQELRREETVAEGVKWLHKILWPDGVFLTKHPSRQANNGQEGSFEQRLEAARRAGIVREIILERAPAALVSLIGRRQYQRCATDLFFFLQSAVCLKQLTYSLLELLLLSAFPELQDIVLEVRSM